MAVEITGQYDADRICTVMRQERRCRRYGGNEPRGVNICNFRPSSRAQKGGTAVMTIEVDGALEPDVNSAEKLPNVLSSTMLAPT